VTAVPDGLQRTHPGRRAPGHVRAPALPGRSRGTLPNPARENENVKRYRWLLSGFLALGFALAPLAYAKNPGAPGEPPKKKKGERKQPKRKTGLRGYYAVVASVCKLTDEQVAKLKEALKPYQDAQKANKDKLTELRKAQSEARKAKDKDKAAAIAKDIKAIQGPINALRAKAMDVLTDEQKIVWEGQLLYQSAMRRYKKAELDEAQTKKIREMCDAKAKDAFEAKDEKAKRRMRSALTKQIGETVLTPEQRAKLKKPKPAKAKKPKEGAAKGAEK